MKNNVRLTALLFLIFLPNTHAIEAKKAHQAPIIDGIGTDKTWHNATWHPLSELIVGHAPTAEDFSGKFKIKWDNNKLYLLVEIVDDILFDQHANPLYFYWDDDCIEIFIDEDASGGNHQFNFNAFAYHVALDNQAVDIGYKTKKGEPDFLTLNDHIESSWRRSETSPHSVTWELAISVYDDKFSYTTENGKKQFTGEPVSLFAGKKLGFMLAYCDNDGSKERESFIGSTAIKAINGDKNLGYITADVFDTLVLIDE